MSSKSCSSLIRVADASSRCCAPRRDRPGVVSVRGADRAAVRDLVRLIVERTERHVEAIFITALDAELQRRRNGETHALVPPSRGTRAPTTTKRCRRCGETKPLADFPRSRATCTTCKPPRSRAPERASSAARRRRAAPGASGRDEDGRAAPGRAPDRSRERQAPRSDRGCSLQRRRVRTERDGREFRVIHLPRSRARRRDDGAGATASPSPSDRAARVGGPRSLIPSRRAVRDCPLRASAGRSSSRQHEILDAVRSTPRQPAIQDEAQSFLVSAYGCTYRCFSAIRELAARPRCDADDALVLTRSLVSIVAVSLWSCSPSTGQTVPIGCCSGNTSGGRATAHAREGSRTGCPSSRRR